MGVLAERLKPTAVSEAEVTAEVNLIVKNLLAICNPSLVYLFGSAAEGHATSLSDIDICVIFSSKDELKRDKRQILCGFPTGKVPIDWLLLDLETFNKKKGIGGVCFDINKFGTLVYQRG